MGNIGNALYLFTESLCDASTGALAYSILHLDVYEEYKGSSKKWIRFSGMRGGEPMLKGTEVIRDNAVYYVYFVAQPETQSAQNRVEARELTEDMASEWLAAYYNDRTLGNRVCDLGDVFEMDDWIKPGNVRMPAKVLQLKINPR